MANQKPASFQIKYGNPVPVTEQTPSGYSLTAAWQTGLGQGAGESLPGEQQVPIDTIMI